METWKPVPDHHDYEVSDLGRVRSLDRVVPNGGSGRLVRGRVLTGGKNHGYPKVTVDGRTVQVHKLVLLAFVGPAPVGMQCRHLNGDRADARLVNLAWGTVVENAADRVAHGTINRGELNGRAKLTWEAVRTIREARSGGESTRYIAERFGVSVSIIRNVTSGQTWKELT